MMKSIAWMLSIGIFAQAVIIQNVFAQDITPPATCNFGAANTSAPPEIEQFAFLIGDYKVTLHAWQGENWSPPSPGVTARWNGRYGLNGMAIIDEWYNPDPAQNASAGLMQGINVRMYDPDAEEWDMMWVATGGHQVQDLRAKILDDKLTMWQVYPERESFRAEFNVIDDDQWNRISFIKNDEDLWVPQFKLAATRIPCDG